MEWTNKKTIALIDLYRKRDVLWNCRLKEFKDRKKRIEALMEIAASIGVDKEEIERKIKNLVCHFSREVKKEKEGSKFGAGSDENYKSKWFCFESLSFLKDRYRRRRMTNAERQDQNTSADVEVTNEETQNVKQEPSEEPASNKRRVLFKSPKAQLGSHKNSKSSVKEALSIMKYIQGRSALKDQYTVFGEQVGMRIRDLKSSNSQKVIKHLISNLLFEAEMGKFDNVHPSPQPLLTYNAPPFTMAPFSSPSPSKLV